MSDDLADRPMYGLVVALIYGTIAVAANFINKYAMMILPLPNLVLLIKTFTMLAVTQVLAWTGVITLPPLTVARLQKDMPICLIYVAHANLVLRCLMNLSVPMYNTLKRLCPVMVLVAKSVIERKLPDLGTTGSVLTSVLGCILAGLGDLEFNTQGYFLALTCAMLQASYIILAEYAGKKAVAESAAKAELEAAQVKAGKTVAPASSGNNSEGTFEIMHSVGIVGTPILMLLVLQSGEQNVAVSTFERQWELLGPLTFTSWMTMISVIEGMLTGTMMWCSAVNSALTTSVVGVLKGIFAVALGFFLLGGVEFSFLNVLGMSVNIVGGVWYTVLKYRQASAKKSSAKVEMASKELSASEKAPLLANGGDLDHGSSGYGKV